MTTLELGAADGHWLVRCQAEGPVVALAEPLSFWGGFDAATGSIIDRRHPQIGVVLTGAIVVMSAGRGSSSASSVIAEAIRLGTAPKGIVMAGIDEIVALGAIVADELYGLAMGVVVVQPATFAAATAADSITLAG